MKFEWDAQKARRNASKHGVQFADAVAVLEDDRALTMSEESMDGEERWIALGTDAFGRVLVVVYTWRHDRVRMISARPATPAERVAYGEAR
ncbi:MAG: BrnT family toxin [Candidatus Solibacter sp.]